MTNVTQSVDVTLKRSTLIKDQRHRFSINRFLIRLPMGCQ